MLHCTNLISHFIGQAAYLKLPSILGKLSVNTFAKLYRINLNEAEYELSHYRTVGELFTRNLKIGSRPIGTGILSPVDGKIRDYGEISTGTFTDIKGRRYTISKLLNNSAYDERFNNGYFYNFYLSPQNYHHIHTPLAGTLLSINHVAGSLLPVNDWALNRYTDLFSRNERKTIILDTSTGLLAIVMVAALNVGGIEIIKQPTYRAGERIGTFRLGSSVIILLENQPKNFNDIEREQAIKYGESLAQF